MRVTIKRVNEALRSAGLDVEIVKGRGYWYFAGEMASHWAEQGVYGVGSLQGLTVEQWVGEAVRREREEHRFDRTGSDATASATLAIVAPAPKLLLRGWGMCCR